MNWKVVTIIGLLALAGLAYWGYTKYMKPVQHKYAVHKDTDYPTGNFIEHLPETTDVDELKKQCNSMDKCIGFSTEGYLVPALEKAVDKKGVDFYIKGKAE